MCALLRKKQGLPVLDSVRKLSHQFAPVALRALGGLYKSRLPQMAAALAYRTIFALVPVIIIGLVVLRLLVVDESELRGRMNDAVEFLGLRSLVAVDPQSSVTPFNIVPEDRSLRIHSSLVRPGEVSERPGPESMPTSAIQPDTTTAQPIDSVIDGILSHFARIPFGAIGGFGVLLLIYAAISMLVELERAFNQIYRAPRGRSWVRRVTQYWSVLTLGVIFLVASFYVGQTFSNVLNTFAATDGMFSRQGFAFGMVGYLSTVAISSALLLFMYKTIPNVRVPFGPAIVGAVVAAILWEAGKWGFTRYIALSTSYQYIYGSIAIVPLFILWVYLTWLVVLFGLQVSYGLQYASASRDSSQDNSVGPSVVDASRAVDLAVLLATRFDQGGAVDAGDASEHLSLPTDICALLLDRLEHAELVRRIETHDAGDEPSWMLARPAAKVFVADVLACATDTSRQRTDDIPDSELPPSARVMRAMRAAIEGRTVADCAMHDAVVPTNTQPTSACAGTSESTSPT